MTDCQNMFCLICKDNFVDGNSVLKNGKVVLDEDIKNGRNPTQLACGHIFHIECVRSSSEFLGKVCPYCSTKFRRISSKLPPQFVSENRNLKKVKDLSNRCMATTSSGKRCMNSKMYGKDNCWMHKSKQMLQTPDSYCHVPQTSSSVPQTSSSVPQTPLKKPIVTSAIPFIVQGTQDYVPSIHTLITNGGGTIMGYVNSQ